MRRVLKARKLAARLMGWEAPVRAIDDFILDCHTRQLTGQQIVEGARAAAPKPDRLREDRPAAEWPDDPAVGLLGPWVEPTDIHDAIVKLRQVEFLLDQRRVLLAKAYSLIRIHYLWTSVPGCNSLAELCAVHLEVSQRTFQRYCKEGLHHIWFPKMEKEIAEGRITADRALFAMSHGNEATMEEWLDLARRLGRVELERVGAWERERDLRPREAYAPALELAHAVEGFVRRVKEGGETLSECATAIGGPASTTEGATAIGGMAEAIARHLLEVGATGLVQVALRDDARRRPRAREPAFIYAPPGLLAAADYLLAVVEEPRQYGPRKVVEHDGWVCQNPRCRRLTLRVHVHHLVERQHGGTDDLWNVITLCPACHLRQIHSGRMSVVRKGDWLVWSWRDGGSVLMHSPVSDARASTSARS
jgi:hypothetical protein